MAWQDTSADAVRCVRIISREVPACTVPDVSFLYMASVASLAQLVEHVLRKRMVVGSIPTGGFCWADTGIQLHEAHHFPEPNLKLQGNGDSECACILQPLTSDLNHAISMLQS